MSVFCALSCNMIPAHHILPDSRVEEVSAATVSAGVNLGILSCCPHRNVQPSVLVRLSAHCFSRWCVFFSPLTLSPPHSPVFSFSPILNLLPPSTCVCQWMTTGSATSTTCGSTPCQTCWGTSTPTPSPSSLEALLTSRYVPMCKCSEAPLQVQNSDESVSKHCQHALNMKKLNIFFLMAENLSDFIFIST